MTSGGSVSSNQVLIWLISVVLNNLAVEATNTRPWNLCKFSVVQQEDLCANALELRRFYSKQLQ